MPNLGRSLVYSPGRMKATHITNSFALSSRVICCFPPLLRFQHATSITWNRIQQQLGLLKASEAQQNETVSYMHPGEAELPSVMPYRLLLVNMTGAAGFISFSWKGVQICLYAFRKKKNIDPQLSTNKWTSIRIFSIALHSRFVKGRCWIPTAKCCLVGLVVILAPVRCQTLGTSTVTSLLYFQTVKGYGSLPRHAAVSPSTLGSLNHLNPFK